MTAPTTITGGCLCGALRYEIRGPVASCTHCHCAMCRRASGAAVVTWITTARDNFHLTRGTPRVFRSSAHAERGFCERCGTPISFVSENAPHDIDVTLGSLDDPEQFPADHHIWTSSAVAWLQVDPALPAYPEWSPDDDSAD